MRLLLMLFTLFMSVPSSGNEIDYQISADTELTNLKITVCFKDFVPDALYNGSDRRNRWLDHARDATGKNLSMVGHKMLLSSVKVGQCINYQVLLPNTLGGRRSHFRVADDIVLDTHMWLWQPKSVNRQDTVTLTFKLPNGYQVSSPWPQTTTANQFTLTPTPYHWTSRIAIGKFHIATLTIANQNLKVAVLGSTENRRREYLAWIKQAADAIAAINGVFPVNDAQIIITPIGAKREAVPWGEVQRGGSVAAHFFVDSYRPIAEFKNDWTAAHELSHMLVPYIDRDELYLSEGIASYYQNVARAKHHMITPTQAWDKLLAGFSRGTRAARRESLSNTSATMQLYWGGAAIYLMADLQLRQMSNNQQTLGTVLKAFNQCCRPSVGAWTGKQLMQKFDQLSSSKIFITLYQQAQQRRFPDILPPLRDLGFDGLDRHGKRLSAAAEGIILESAVGYAHKGR